MDQAVATGKNINKSAKRHNIDDWTFIDFPDGDFFTHGGKIIDDLGETGVGSARDEDRAVVINVDGDFVVGHELFDVFAPRANELADLVHRDLDCGDARGIGGQLRAGPGQHFEHGGHDLVTGSSGAGQGFFANV